MPRTRLVQHYALAMKINDAQMLVGGRVSDCETHGQGERVEPRRAARPGSEPAGFHLTPSTEARAVAARLSPECPIAVAIGLTTLVNRRYSPAE